MIKTAGCHLNIYTLVSWWNATAIKNPLGNTLLLRKINCKKKDIQQGGKERYNDREIQKEEEEKKREREEKRERKRESDIERKEHRAR